MSNNSNAIVHGSVPVVSARKQLQYLIRHLWIVVVFAMVGLAATLLVTMFLVPKQYYSSARYYITKADMDIRYVSMNELEFMNLLILDVEQMVGSETFFQSLVSKQSITVAYEDYKENVRFDINTKSRYFQAGYVSTDPNEAYRIAVAIYEILPEESKSFLKIPDISLVDAPYNDQKPVSPILWLNAALGFISGLILGVLILGAVFVLRGKIMFSEEIAAAGLHVFAHQRRWSTAQAEKWQLSILTPIQNDPDIEQLMMTYLHLNVQPNEEKPYRILILSDGQLSEQSVLTARLTGYMMHKGIDTLVVNMGAKNSKLYALIDDGVPQLKLEGMKYDKKWNVQKLRESFENLLEAKRKNAQCIIIDALPLTLLHAEYNLESFADVAVIVVKSDTTTVESLRMTRMLIEQNQIPLAGVVFVD